MHLTRLARLFVEDVPQNRRDVVGTVGMVRGREFVEQHAKGMEVGSPIGSAVRRSKLLRRRVLEGAYERTSLGKSNGFVLKSRDTEIHHLDDVLLRDEHVLRLDVAVDRACGMDCGKPLGDLPSDVAAQLLGDALELEQQVSQGHPLDVLHHEEVLLGPLVERRVAVVGLHHVLVLHRLPQLRLPEEAFEEARLIQQVGMDHLQRDGRAGF